MLLAGTDFLVAAGPSEHNTTSDDTQTIFDAYPEYYRGTPAIEKMFWIHYDDSTICSIALLDGNVQFADADVADFLDQFLAAPDIIVGYMMK
jgi:hypothetical protein